MNVSIECGTMEIERLQAIVEWLKAAPLRLENLDFSGIVQKGDVNVKIHAPRVHSKVTA